MAGQLDAHARPPQAIKNEFKHHQKASVSSSPLAQPPLDDDIASYEVDGIEGLIVYPAFFSQAAQLSLLESIFHRDLMNPAHKTNVHMHYDVPYPAVGRSYFDEQLTFLPKEPSCHKPFSSRQYLDKKLRWMTLGGQYDWTDKVYPTGPPPSFPNDIKTLVEQSFPMKAEAAIVNLYSPGDTLSLHRDVSEMCDQPLVSISIGCDCLFTIGLEAQPGMVAVKTLRLRSGDAVLMSGPSRYAWHGVPKIIPNTCPGWLQDWPGEQHQDWSGWMSSKRINLNVRQMYA